MDEILEKPGNAYESEKIKALQAKKKYEEKLLNEKTQEILTALEEANNALKNIEIQKAKTRAIFIKSFNEPYFKLYVEKAQTIINECDTLTEFKEKLSGHIKKAEKYAKQEQYEKAFEHLETVIKENHKAFNYEIEIALKLKAEYSQADENNYIKTKKQLLKTANESPSKHHLTALEKFITEEKKPQLVTIKDEAYNFLKRHNTKFIIKYSLLFLIFLFASIAFLYYPKFKVYGTDLKIFVNQLNLKNGPDNKYSTIKVFHKNDVLKARWIKYGNKNHPWINVTDLSGKISGYIDAKQVFLKKNSVVFIRATIPNENVNLRERPGGIYKVTRVLPKEEKLIILTPVKGINETLWYKVRGSNFIGYVSFQDIRLVPWSYPRKIQLLEKNLYLVVIGSFLALILIIFIKLKRLNKLQTMIP